MDFFEAQARAKKRTSRLVVLFGLAVVGTVLASYLAAALILRSTSDYRSMARGRYRDTSAFGVQPAMWQPQLFAGVTLTTLAVVGLASLYKWHEFSAGGSAVAESVGGRRVDPRTTDLKERQLLNVVEEMAIASGVPVPAVYLLDEEPAINAFAAGLTTSDAVVTVTRGTLDKLTRDELQGVIAHEFSHILNGDMRLNLRIAALVFGILVIGLAGRGILWGMMQGRWRGDRKSSGLMFVIALVGIALLIVGYVGYFFGRLVQAAVSRQREFLADASSVQFTRNPAGITGALRKIGGYALGSTLLHNQSAAIGHFFFAQSFRTGVTGLWATHPPLDERIRAVDPRWDGTFFAPPEVVHVARESFVEAGLAPAKPVPAPPLLPPTASVAALAAIGTLSPQQISHAQLLLDATPARLREAARSPHEAAVLLYGLLLDRDAAVRSRQRDLVASRAGAEAARTLDELAPALRDLRDEHRLPLLQLALPALRELPGDALDPFLDTLDELVHADASVSPFEFALQKILTRALALGRTPTAAVVQIYSFNAVIDEISLVLSALAHASTQDTAAASQAFATGAAQIKLIENQLHFVTPEACDFEQLDAALDKLATGSLPIKQRTLVAAAHVVNADGRVLLAEFELLRAVAAALDIPMPPMAVAA